MRMRPPRLSGAALSRAFFGLAAASGAGAVGAQASFDTASSVLTVPAISVGNLEYRNLQARLDTDGRLSVLGLAGPFIPEPRWAKVLQLSSILPGVGLSSIRLGDHETTIVLALGLPTTSATPIRDLAGNFLHYHMQYRYTTASLNLYLNAGRQMQGLRMIDDSFGSSINWPRTSTGLTLGSPRGSIQAALGSPFRTDAHASCPQILGYDATTRFYAGIAFNTCNANALVYWIDIP
jgi:hypothetical protein